MTRKAQALGKEKMDPLYYHQEIPQKKDDIFRRTFIFQVYILILLHLTFANDTISLHKYMDQS